MFFFGTTAKPRQTKPRQTKSRQDKTSTGTKSRQGLNLDTDKTSTRTKPRQTKPRQDKTSTQTKPRQGHLLNKNLTGKIVLYYYFRSKTTHFQVLTCFCQKCYKIRYIKQLVLHNFLFNQLFLK